MPPRVFVRDGRDPSALGRSIADSVVFLGDGAVDDMARRMRGMS